MNLDDLHAAQYDDVRFSSDHAYDAFMAEIHPDQARTDLASHMTDVEIRHLGRTR